MRNSSPPQDPIEKEFSDALTRLQQGRPRHTKLAKLVERGVARINIANVALEAGHSRTLIGHANCKYPKVRASILAAKKPILIVTTALSTIRALRQNIQELRDQIRRNDSVNAALVIRSRESERRVVALERRLSRRNKEDDHHPPAGHNVTPFPRK